MEGPGEEPVVSLYPWLGIETDPHQPSDEVTTVGLVTYKHVPQGAGGPFVHSRPSLCQAQRDGLLSSQ